MTHVMTRGTMPSTAGVTSGAPARAELGAVLVMGVVNVTPDSFSDGGAYLDPEAAVAHGLALLGHGADILDVGGEATNPRAQPVTAEDEIARVVPVIERLARAGARVSVDTTKAAVARAAVAAGATIVNDVSGGLFDPEMPATLGALTAAGDVTYIAGHLRGRSLAEVFAAEGAVGWRRVAAELADRLAALPEAVRARAWIDPGLGFGKGAEPDGNLELLRHAGDLGRELGRPVVVGPSRKRFLRRLLGPALEAEAAALDVASVAACLGAVRAGAHVRASPQRCVAPGRARGVHQPVGVAVDRHEARLRAGHDCLAPELLRQPHASATVATTVVDVALVYYLIYRLLLTIRGTRAAQMVVGIVLVGAAFFVAERVELTTVSWLLDNFISLLHHPHHRRVPAGHPARARPDRPERDAVRRASRRRRTSSTRWSRRVAQLARARMGAIVVFERDAALEEFVDDATRIDAVLSRQLLVSLFVPARTTSCTTAPS